MEKEVLVILMIAFGLFAIIMFVLFFTYLKKYYNSKRINDDYKKDFNDTTEPDEPINNMENMVQPEPINAQENVVQLEPINPIENIEPKEEIKPEEIVKTETELENDVDFIPIKKK